MTIFLDEIRRLFAGIKRGASSEESSADIHVTTSLSARRDAALDGRSLPQLISLIKQTKEDEYTCEETLDLLDEYVELVASGQDAGSDMPMVKGHLEDCVDCTERYEALLKIVEG